jgi:hypothetical protein
MKKAALTTIAICILITLVISCGRQTSSDQSRTINEKSLKASLKDHPRLFISPERISELKLLSQEDKTLAALIGGLIQRADLFIDQPVLEFKIIGPRMLNRCQQIGDRVSTLALAYNLTDDSKYLERAKAELFNACNDPHWNKDHFLDGAELCLAFGIGYDWLYDALTREERNIIRQALVEKGLRIGLSEMQNNVHWKSSPTSWNSVVNGGLTAGALSVADEVPEISAPIIDSAVRNLPVMFASYTNQGAWEAGPDYWGYATRHSILAIDALMTSLGSDYGLMQSEGLKNTGFFPIQMTGPFDWYFNFADGWPESLTKPELFWLGKNYATPYFIKENHRLLKNQVSYSETLHSFNVIPLAFNIVWYQPEPGNVIPLPKGIAYERVGAASMRSAWNDPDAIFIGFKGGFNQADHAHLDIGSFVLDAEGERWAFDLGRDDYDIPGYWETAEGAGRWKIFRLSNLAHNTLTLNDDVQRVAANAPFRKSGFSESKSFAVADITSAYIPHVQNALRGIALTDNNTVFVQDEITWAGKERKARWQLTTDADIELKGSEAILTKNGKTMHVSIKSPKNAIFRTTAIQKDLPENPNQGFRQLTIELIEKGNKTTICVAFSTGQPGPAPGSLESW